MHHRHKDKGETITPIQKVGENIQDIGLGNHFVDKTHNANHKNF